MKEILLRIKYPKLSLLILTFLLAYLIFIGRNLLPFYDELLSLGYVGVFLVGIFYTYGFTSAPATTNATVVEILNVWQPSPPVPHVSITVPVLFIVVI